jgi:hypothetical protein
MKRFELLPDGTKVWPKYPQWKNTPGMPKPNRSRLNRGKMRLKYNSLYASDRAKRDAEKLRQIKWQALERSLEEFLDEPEEKKDA